MKKLLIGLSLLFGAGLTVSQAVAANDYTNLKISEKQNIQIELTAQVCKFAGYDDEGEAVMARKGLIGHTFIIRPTDFVNNKWERLLTDNFVPNNSQLDVKMYLYTVPVLGVKYISKSSSIGPINTTAYGKKTEAIIGECEEPSHVGNIILSANIDYRP